MNTAKYLFNVVEQLKKKKEEEEKKKKQNWDDTVSLFKGLGEKVISNNQPLSKAIESGKNIASIFVDKNSEEKSVISGSITDMAERQRRLEAEGYFEEDKEDETVDVEKTFWQALKEKAVSRIEEAKKATDWGKATATSKTMQNEFSIDNDLQSKLKQLENSKPKTQQEADEINQKMARIRSVLSPDQSQTYLTATKGEQTRKAIREQYNLPEDTEINIPQKKYDLGETRFLSDKEIKELRADQGLMKDAKVATQMFYENAKNSVRNFVLMASEFDPLQQGQTNKDRDFLPFIKGYSEEQFLEDVRGEIRKSAEKQQNLLLTTGGQVNQTITKVINMGENFGLAIALSGMGQPELASISLGSMEALPLYQEARDAGVSANKAMLTTVGAWTATTALESAGITMFFKNVNRASKGFVQKSLTDRIFSRLYGASVEGVSEGTEEVLQQISQNIARRVSYDDRQDIMEGVVESFIYGGLLGGMATGAVSVVQAVKDSQITNKLSKAFEIPKAKAEIVGLAVVEEIKKGAMGFMNDLTGGNFERNNLSKIKDPEKQAEIIDAVKAVYQVKPKQNQTQMNIDEDQSALLGKYKTTEEQVDPNYAQSLIQKALAKDISTKSPEYIQSLFVKIKDEEARALRNGVNVSNSFRQGHIVNNLKFAVDELSKIREIRTKDIIDDENINRLLSTKSKTIQLELFPATEKIKTFAKAKNINIEGYKHFIDSNSLQHSLNRHSKDKLPINKEDFKKIPEIINTYDDVYYEGKNKLGLETFKYKKAYNGTTYYVEEVRTGKKQLMTKTMYKVPTKKIEGALSTPEGAETIRTSQIENPTTSISNKSISETENNSNLSILHTEALKYKSADEFIKSQVGPVYHGTSAEFDVFDIEKSGDVTWNDWGRGIYFTNKKEVAQSFAHDAEATLGGKANIKEVYLNIKNPARNKDVVDPDIQNAVDDDMGALDMGEILAEKGFDGIEFIHRVDGKEHSKEYVVFDPEQIKTKAELETIWKEANNPKTMFQGIKDPSNYRVISQIEAKHIAEKYFTDEELKSGVLEFVDNIQTPEGLEAFGRYYKGIVSLINAPAESTVPHEAVHYFLDNFTPNKQEIIDEVKRTQKIDDDVMAEEFLADAFVEYAKTQHTNKSLSQKIKDYIIKAFNKMKVLFGKGDKIQKFYDDILAKKRTNKIGQGKAKYQTMDEYDGEEQNLDEQMNVNPEYLDPPTEREVQYYKNVDEYKKEAVRNGYIFIDPNAPEDIQQASYEMFTEMEIAEAGFRMADDDGDTISAKSSFPDWLPETETFTQKQRLKAKLEGKKLTSLSNLRSKSLIDRVVRKLVTQEPIVGKAEKELLGVMLDELSKRTHIDLDEYNPTGLLQDKETEYNKGGLKGEKIAKQITGEKILTPVQELRRKFELRLLKERIKNRSQIEEIKTEGKEKIAQIKQKQEDIEAIKNVMKDYAVKNLPLRERGKLLATIKNIKKDSELLDVLDKIDEMADQATKRETLEKIDQLMSNTKAKNENGVLKGKYTPEIQRELEEIRSVIKMSRTEANNLIAISLDKMGDNIPDYDTARQNAILNRFAGLKDMDAKTVVEVYAEIKSLIENGRYMRLLKDFNRKSDIDRMAEKAVQVITGGKGLSLGSKSIKTITKEDVNKVSGWLAVTSIITFDDWSGLMDRLSKYDRDSLPYKSFLSTMGDVYLQERAETEGMINRVNEMREAYKTIFETKTDSKTLDQINRDTREIDLGTFINANGTQINLKLSKAEARKKYMELMDPTLTASFMSEDGMAWTPEIIKAVQDMMTPQDLKWIEWQMEFYSKYYDGVNKIYSQITGIDLPKNKNYTPIAREGVSKVEQTGFSEFLQEITGRKSVMNGSLKGRVNNNLKIKFTSDLSVLQEHIAEMEHFKAWALKIRELRAVFGNPDVRQAIIENHGAGMLTMVTIFIDKFTSGGMEKKNRFKIWDKARVNFTRGVLGLNPDLFVKQMTSMFTYMDEMPTTAWIEYTAKFWTNPLKHARELMASPFMVERSSNMERDIKTAMASDKFKNFRKGDSLLNSLMFATQMGDKVAILTGGWSVYEYNRVKFIKQGMSESEANKKALLEFERATKKSQQSGYVSDQSWWQSANSITKMFTMFKSSPNQYFRKEMGALRNLVYKRGSPISAIKTIFIYHVLMPNIFQLVSNMLRWDEKEQLRATILGSFNGLFIFGDIADSLLRKALGLYDYGFAGLNLAPFTTYSDIKKTIDNLSEKDVDDSDIKSAVDGLLSATSKLSGIPIKQGIDTLRGVVDIAEGEYMKGLSQVLGFGVPKDDKETKETSTTKKVRPRKETSTQTKKVRSRL